MQLATEPREDVIWHSGPRTGTWAAGSVNRSNEPASTIYTYRLVPHDNPAPDNNTRWSQGRKRHRRTAASPHRIASHPVLALSDQRQGHKARSSALCRFLLRTCHFLHVMYFHGSVAEHAHGQGHFPPPSSEWMTLWVTGRQQIGDQPPFVTILFLY